jgi:DNA-binding beta-propeller fold protein YncE
MRYTVRLVAFVLALLLGVSVWCVLAYRSRTAGTRIQSNKAPAVNETKIPAPPPQPVIAPAQFVKFGPVGQLTGYANATSVTLRQSPNANAPVLATLTAHYYDSVEILGATRDFLRVRFPVNEGMGDGGTRTRDYEGWVTWREVAPDLSAIILDAATGEVISRVPLGEERTSIAYSPDGLRAIFYHQGRASTLAQEVRTSDYTLTRHLVSSGPDGFGSLFYGPTDGALYAPLFESTNSGLMADVKFDVIRVGDTCAPNTSTELSATATDFVVAPDGRTGFILHAKEGGIQPKAVTIDVVELDTLKIRNTFTLEGSYVPRWSRMLIVNRDGSELYSTLSLDSDTIKVIDTRTGQRLREFPTISGATTYFEQQNVVGDSLLMHTWNATDAHAPPPVLWLGLDAMVAAQGEITYAVEAGYSRFAVNNDGTRLFKLDADNRIIERLPIERPDIRRSKSSQWPFIIMRGLTASPDGKRLVMFVGKEHGC